MSAHDILMGAAGGTSLAANYVEDVFSTYLYTGNGSTQTITNGIDLSGKGGLTWIKSRTVSNLHNLVDTNRGANLALDSSTTLANWNTASGGVTSFNSNGFSLGNFGSFNGSGTTFASWTFREQPKFFDVVTYTGTGANRTIAHNLGSVPGCFIVKCTSDGATEWFVYHRSLTSANYHLRLNQTNAEISLTAAWNDTAPTSSVFTLGTDDRVNGSGRTYVAYLFAHNAGGFGLTGTDNVISCGSFTTDGSANATVTLGYEPQFVIFKRTDSSTNGDWVMFDNMRGMPATGTGSTAARLRPNTADAENPNTGDIKITSTGFVVNYVPSANFIYIAIRRGPMKVPTSGTSVFTPIARTGTGSTYNVTSLSFPPDLIHAQSRDDYGANTFYDRLRGGSKILFPHTFSAEGTNDSISSFGQNGFSGSGVADYANYSDIPYVFHAMRRAPGFFDEVCYTGTGPASVPHNLGVPPFLIIAKARSVASDWFMFTSNGTTNFSSISLNSNSGGYSEAGTPASYGHTATTFDTSGINGSGSGYPGVAGVTYVAYLFATCPGVSKVGSYTGTGTTQVINCGFTSGARFILIKRTDSTGDWYVWDSARGIVAGNDPYLLLNSAAAEVTSTDYVDPVSSGFAISSTAPAAINASGGSYIYLAIA